MSRALDKAAFLLGTGFGVGLIPFAPGTFGTLWGLPLAWGIQQLPLAAQAAVIVGVFLAGIPICGRAAALMNKPDPGAVVFDEIAAMPLVFLAVPVDWKTACLGFVWFRLFDISKPPPVSRLEKLHGGLGIMIDDAVAAVYAAIALWISATLFGLATRIPIY